MTRSLTSASNIARRKECPGSAAAEAEFPEQEDSDESKEGTMLHLIDAQPEKANEFNLKGEQKDVLEAAKRADDDIFRSVHACLKLPADEPYEEVREEEMWVYRGLKKVFPGHCDRLRFYPSVGVLVIIDKKFGRNEVTPAEANMQLRSYGVMGARRFKPKHVMVAINQPRLKYDDRVTIAEYRDDQLPGALADVLAVWDGSHNADGSPRTDVPRIAGQEQCRYCRARLHCDAYRAKFEFLAKPSSEEGKDAFIERLTALSDSELDRVQVAIQFASVIKDDVKAEIIRRMEAGRMGNYEMKPTGNTSSISDVRKAFELLEGIGFSQEEIIRRSKLSLDSLAEDLHAKDGGTQIAAKRKIRDTLGPVLDVTPKSPSLKRLRAPEDFEVLPPAPKQEALL
jgi:hypothetical protein